MKAHTEKEDVFQAVLLADNFTDSIFGGDWANGRDPTRNAFDDDESEDDESKPQPTETRIDQKLSQESLTPLANRKLLDYSLEALTISGVQEIFIYCSSGSAGGSALKEHITNSKWNELNVKINVLSSDCDSLGDALRDLDAKGALRNDFVLMSAGVVTNINLKPLLEEHRKTVKSDKGAVMTLVHRKMPQGHRSRSKGENEAVVVDAECGKLLAIGKLKISMENIRTKMSVILDSVYSGITICSSSVLPLFTDNFDFRTLHDFIKNILINEEVMGHSIYFKLIKSGYASRIVDFDSFLGIKLDILERWSYPLVPDMPFGYCSESHQLGLNFVYRGSGVKSARSAVIGPAVSLSAGAVIGEKAIVKNSCIGKDSIIGEGAVVNGSQLGEGVFVEAGCIVEKCIVLEGSRISDNISETLVVGNLNFQIKARETEEESDSEPEEEEKQDGHQEVDFKRFSAEVSESLHRGFTDNVALENLFVEIQGSRTANYMYFDDATVAVIKGILGLAPKLHQDFSQLPLLAQWNFSKEVIVRFKELLKLYVKNEAAMDNLLKTIEEYANDNEYFRPMILQVLQFYYAEDILTEDVVLRWHGKESLYEAGVEIRRLVQKFIDWLETASEESE